MTKGRIVGFFVSLIAGACLVLVTRAVWAQSCDSFRISYAAYIPVDHVPGAALCQYNPPLGGNPQYYVPTYMGDADRGTYRSTEYIQTTADSATATGFFANTGQTRNYGFGSPVNGPNLSGQDEDGVRYDCFLWNDLGQASTSSMYYDMSYPYGTQAQFHSYGSATNPLDFQIGSIAWDMRTVVDDTSPSSPTAYVNYNHTCYPAHIVKVNDLVVYSYTPSRNDPAYIVGCLTGVYSHITGVSSTSSVPTQ